LFFAVFFVIGSEKEYNVIIRSGSIVHFFKW